MKLTKSIEILQGLVEYLHPSNIHDDKDAIKLGIEALQQELRNRLSFPKVPIRLLPGEEPE